MGQPFSGEIRLFAGNFAPLGWAFCEGQLLPISEYEVLFTLIGTTYGGDGQSTFALPDLRGRVAVHQGPGFVAGQSAGVEFVTLTTAQLPPHTHPFLASADSAASPNPEGRTLAETATTTPYFQGSAAVALASSSMGPAGGNQPHSNLQPFLCMNHIICLQGIFPTRS
ncbi:MAG: phage tail protein [Verrucomicrobia bacterium]|nr:phage tail protein [Verrucomicrobiota bacterium]MBI3868731.1 phage tail protein [Verrucomicrobiota bacterium]